MINQYKIKEEEQNRYVDPKTGDEFKYAPGGTSPILNAPVLVDVPSLSVPVTIRDVQTEETNFAKNLEDIKDKKQEIEEKKREIKVKELEMKSKEKEKNDTLDKFTELNTEEKDKKQKLADDQKTLADLKKLTKPTVREQAKIRRFDVTIPKLESRVLALPALVANMEKLIKN